MEKRILAFMFGCIFMFGFMLNVNADTFRTKNYGFYITNQLKCGTKNVYLEQYTLDGKVYVRDSNDKIYLWKSDNTCQAATPQEMLDMYNDYVSYTEQEDNIFYETFELTGYSKLDGSILNKEPYDPNKEYWVSDGSNGWYNAEMIFPDLVDNFDDYTVYLQNTFYLIDSAIYNPNKTYYKMVDEDKGIFEKVTGPFTEEEAVKMYYIEDDYTRLDKEPIKYVYNEDVYDSLIEMYETYNYYYIDLALSNGKLIANVTYEDEGEYKVKHYDEEGKEIYPELENYYVSQASPYVIYAYDVDYKFLRLYDIEFNLITEINLEDAFGIYGYPVNDDVFISYLYGDFNQGIYFIKAYSVLEGKNQIYESKNLSFRFSGDLSFLDKVLINGDVLDSKNYAKRSGSTIIELNKDYLDSLNPGEYTISAVYKDGVEISTTFTIPVLNRNIINPKTGDGIAISILFGLISLAFLVKVGRIIVKRKPLVK